MKKLIYCAAVLVTALFAGSCQRELLDPAQDGSTVTFTVNVPEVATKSIGDAHNVNNLVYAVYRVTGETEADAKKGLTPEKLVYQDHNSVVEGKSTVTLELINDQAYVVVFWAQVANTWFDNDYQFGTKTVTYPSGLVANDDKYSAFYGVSYINDVKGPDTKNITLHRPFAQINIATKDPEKYNVAINNTYVSVANAASGFDVAKEKAIVTKNYSVSFEAAPMPKNEKLTVNGVEYQTRVQNTGSKENDVHHYIAMNYVFADGNVDVTYVIDTDHGVVTNTISNVPVAKNYRTNIVGNLLTSDVKYNVELDQDWGPAGDVDNDYVVEVVTVTSAADLVAAIETASSDDAIETNIKIDAEPNADGEKILDLADLLTRSTVAEKPYGLLIPEGKAFVIDLNGCTVTQTKTCTNHYAMIKNNGKLSITDSQESGKIRFTDNGNGDPNFGWGSYTIENCGELVIEGGLIENATTLNPGAGNSNVHMYCAIQQNNAAATTIVNGGKISTPTYRSIRINTGALKINGGVCEGQVWMQPFADGSSIEITDGDFSPRGGDGSSVFVENSTKTVGVAISGGYFRTKLGASNPAALKGVTGGTFAADPSAFVPSDYVAVYNEESQVYTIAEAYAEVGKAKFTSLNAAFEAAEDEATIVVLRDTEMTATVVPAGKTLTLDLNGKTVTGVDATSKNFGLISLSKQSVLTVKNGTMKVSATINSGWSRYSAVLANNQGTLNVENCTIEHLGGTDMAYGIDNLTNSNIGDANATINRATIKSTYRAIRQFLNCDSKENNLTVKNGSVIIGANKSIWMQDPSKKANNGQLVVEEGAELYGDVYLSVTAGSTEWPVSASIPASTLKDGSEVMTGNLPEGYSVEEKNGVYEVTYKSPAQARLEALINEGGEVVLAENIELSSPIEIKNVTVTLDLNGKTITAGKDGYVIENKGELTIKNNGVINGVVYAEGPSAKTTINGGSYNALENAKYVLLNSAGASLEINDATINGGSSYPIYSYDANSKLVINDATVNAKFGCINAYGTNGLVEINGGTFNMTGIQGKTSHIAYFSNVDAVINGGTFNKTGDINMSGTGGGGICAIYGAELTINDGTFTGDYADVYDWGGTNKNERAVSIAIKGGTYKFKPTFLAEDFAATQNADGTWTVAQK